MEDTGYYVAFSHHMGIGPLNFDRIVKHFGSPENAYNAREKDLREIIGDKKMLSNFLTFRKKFPIGKKLKEFGEKDIHVLTRKHPRFPPQLLHISDPPICLYVKGNPDVIDFESDTFFAIVGTRAPTAYGEYVTNLFAGELAQSGLVIVSGMAYGVDAAAHTAALNVRGRTIAFLGCGVDVVYPAANKNIYDRIIAGGGLIVSEFPPGMQTLRGLFVARNRLISGIAGGVLVVEGTAKSGTLITARYAAEQGKDVFAVPGPINSDRSEAPNLLIKDGAKLTLSPDDILEELGLRKRKSENRLDLDSFPIDERKILERLNRESQRIDDIIIATGMSAQIVLNKLSILEINGIISKNKDGKYFLNG